MATIQTSFYWPKRPDGVMIYTAPLLQFTETRITGLTTDPIVLTNRYSQTYTPGHHNFTEEFIFEPRLDPGVPPATHAQLNAANIQLIYVFWSGGSTSSFYVLGLRPEIPPTVNWGGYFRMFGLTRTIVLPNVASLKDAIWLGPA